MFRQPAVLTRNSAPLVLFPVPCAGKLPNRHFELSSRLGSKLTGDTLLLSELVAVPTLVAVPDPIAGTRVPVLVLVSDGLLLKSQSVMS